MGPISSNLFSKIKSAIPHSTKVKIGKFAEDLRNRYRGFRDYYSFPFDVALPLNDKAPRVMEEACTVLENLGIDYYVCDGTALGLAREGKFISHDNDIDVEILGDVDIAAIKRAFWLLGYKVGREVFFRARIQQLIFFSRDEVIFDINFWYDEGNGYAYNRVPELKNGRRQAMKNFCGHEMIHFQGRAYPTHSNIKEWLRAHYGDDWMVPRHSRGDWRDDAQDIVK